MTCFNFFKTWKKIKDDQERDQRTPKTEDDREGLPNEETMIAVHVSSIISAKKHLIEIYSQTYSLITVSYSNTYSLITVIPTVSYSTTYSKLQYYYSEITVPVTVILQSYLQ